MRPRSAPLPAVTLRCVVPPVSRCATSPSCWASPRSGSARSGSRMTTTSRCNECQRFHDEDSDERSD